MTLALTLRVAANEWAEFFSIDLKVLNRRWELRRMTNGVAEFNLKTKSISHVSKGKEKEKEMKKKMNEKILKIQRTCHTVYDCTNITKQHRVDTEEGWCPWVLGG